MPPKYRHYFESYDQEKLLIKAQDVGDNVFKWVRIVFELKGRPPKTLCNTVQGALSGELRLDSICARAIIVQIHSYKSLRSMLINGADNLPLPIVGSIDSHLPQCHENVIGSLKRFKILSDRYRNRRKRFGLRFNLIAGIYNFKVGKNDGNVSEGQGPSPGS